MLSASQENELKQLIKNVGDWLSCEKPDDWPENADLDWPAPREEYERRLLKRLWITYGLLGGSKPEEE